MTQVDAIAHKLIVARMREEKPQDIVNAARMFRPALAVNKIVKAWKEYRA